MLNKKKTFILILNKGSKNKKTFNVRQYVFKPGVFKRSFQETYLRTGKAKTKLGFENHYFLIKLYVFLSLF